MQHLTPVGLSKDGKRLILVSAAGEEYAVPVDQRLRSALRGDHARLGQLEMKMESALRPRDIQARIRAGESPETVAAAAQTSVDAIMGFATPVLAERAHVAQTALASSVRRKSAETSHAARTLGDAARVLVSDLGLREDDVSWDAWRREDGRWTLVADYATGGKPRHATFIYDLRGRYVVADNDEARLLTGEARPAPEQAAPRSPGPRRLSSVGNQDELPLGDDALEMVRDHTPRRTSTEPAAATADAIREAEPTAAETAETAPAAETGRTTDPLAATADADWMAAAPRRITPDRAATTGDDEDPVDGAAPVDEPVHDVPPTPADATPEPTPDSIPEPAPAAEERRPAKKKGRSSVPSWDEIMFGGGKGE
jgi:hypothetical protein